MASLHCGLMESFFLLQGCSIKDPTPLWYSLTEQLRPSSRKPAWTGELAPVLKLPSGRAVLAGSGLAASICNKSTQKWNRGRVLWSLHTRFAGVEEVLRRS